MEAETVLDEYVVLLGLLQTPAYGFSFEHAKEVAQIYYRAALEQRGINAENAVIREAIAAEDKRIEAAFK